jgi:hypothetical protein
VLRTVALFRPVLVSDAPLLAQVEARALALQRAVAKHPESTIRCPRIPQCAPSNLAPTVARTIGAVARLEEVLGRMERIGPFTTGGENSALVAIMRARLALHDLPKHVRKFGTTTARCTAARGR